MFDLLSSMSKEYGIHPTTQTIREYVVPYALKQNYDIERLLLDLKSCGCSVSAGVSAVVINLLVNKELKKAAQIGKIFSSLFTCLIKWCWN